MGGVDALHLPLNGHPLSAGKLARDTMLLRRHAHPTPSLAMAAAKALLDAISGAVLTQTFMDHTVDELADEEMEISLYSRPLVDLA